MCKHYVKRAKLHNRTYFFSRSHVKIFQDFFFSPELCLQRIWSSPPHCRLQTCQMLLSELPSPSCLKPASLRCQQPSNNISKLVCTESYCTVFMDNLESFCVTCSLLMASESWSAFTLQATNSWAVDAATCFAEEISFSSLAWPCTEALAASHRLLVAAATIRAYSKKSTWFSAFLTFKQQLEESFEDFFKATYSWYETVRPLAVIHCIGYVGSHLRKTLH